MLNEFIFYQYQIYWLYNIIYIMSIILNYILSLDDDPEMIPNLSGLLLFMHNLMHLLTIIYNKDNGNEILDDTKCIRFVIIYVQFNAFINYNL